MDLKPGRELDALVAEKVMGWSDCKASDEHGCAIGYTPYWKRETYGCEVVPYYSTSISDAWEIVEKISQKESPSGDCFHFFIDKDDEDYWCCFDSRVPHKDGGMNVIDRFEANSNSAPHAICLAALKAVGEIE